VPPGEPVDDVARRNLEDREEKSRMPEQRRRQARQLAPKLLRLPNRPPRRGGSRRVCVCRNDRVEADRAQLFAVGAEPAEPHASGVPVEPVGFQINLKRQALQSGRIAKMIEIAEEILDLEPDRRLAVGARSAMVLFFCKVVRIRRLAVAAAYERNMPVQQGRQRSRHRT
jgi:hypothetical protein